MPLELFARLVEQAAALGVPALCLNGYGEICTIPVRSLEPYFACIAAQRHRFRLLINTNGNRMDEERSALFLEYGVYLVNVTIDGATRETAESIRVNLDFDRIEANVKRLLALRNAAGKRRPQVRVGMIHMPQTAPEIGLFLQRWRGVADHVGLGGFSTRLGSVESVHSSAGSSPASACVLPFRDLNVWADGKAVPCCEDWNGEQAVGDLNHQTLKEVWNGPEMTAFRRKHFARAGHDLSLCARCNNWQQPSLGARLWA
jgi:MoaA/NifB/PqqE/SkfB family radical SAM enzyme